MPRTPALFLTFTLRRLLTFCLVLSLSTPVLLVGDPSNVLAFPHLFKGFLLIVLLELCVTDSYEVVLSAETFFIDTLVSVISFKTHLVPVGFVFITSTALPSKFS